MSTQAAPEGRAGWTEFAAVVMFAVAFFRVISAIAYFSKSHKLNDLSGGFFSSHVWAWGAWDLCIAALALFAGLSLLAGGGFGRVVAYVWAVLVIVNSFLIIEITPWFAVSMIALAAFVVYGLASSPREAEGARA
jgi:hypothetical protein